MPRRLRAALGGYVYHVLNRAVGRSRLFAKSEDYDAFLRVLADTQAKRPTRLLAFCLMPNHWHLVVWPQRDGELSEFMRLLTVTHTQRWHAHHHTAGTGPLYQGRFKSFPIQEDDHCLTVIRYVERNPLRANLVKCAEDWKWSSLWQRGSGGVTLAEGPVVLPANWTRYVHPSQTEAELAALRRSLNRGIPFGEASWQSAAVERHGLQSTLRPPGRPKKKTRVPVPDSPQLFFANGK